MVSLDLFCPGCTNCWTFQFAGRCHLISQYSRRCSFIQHMWPNHCRLSFWISSSTDGWFPHLSLMVSFRSPSNKETPSITGNAFGTLVVYLNLLVHVSDPYSNTGKISVRRIQIFVFTMTLFFLHKHHSRWRKLAQFYCRLVPLISLSFPALSS